MSFLAPLFLLGLLAIAVPILLHRMNFSDPPSQLFSSILLMKNSEQIASTEKKLRYLLLLAARILALFLLVMLFVQPAVRSNIPFISGPNQIHSLIVLDQSLSMSAPDIWQQAIDKAEARIDALGDNETAQIVGAGSDIRILTDQTADKSALKQVLNRLEPEFSTLDYGLLVGTLDDLAATNEVETRIHFISDLQATNLPVRFSDLVPRRASGLILDRVQPASQLFNWSVTADYSENQVSANIVSHAGPSRDMQVELLIEGRTYASELVNVPASGSALVSFNDLELGIDESRLEVRIEAGNSDAITADNQYYLSTNSAEGLAVLILEAGTVRPGQIFLDTALNSISDPILETDIIAGRAEINLAMAEYDLVILSDIAALSEIILDDLITYTERGGNLLAIAGPATRTRGDFVLTGHSFRQLGVNQEPLGAQGLLIQQPLHGAVSEFSGVIEAKLYGHLEMNLLDGDQVIISANNGYPWLVEHSIGLGRALILSHSLMPRDSDLSLAPEFVPLLRSWVRYLGGSDELPDNFQTGEQIQVGVDSEENRAAPVQQVFLPNGSPFLSLQQQNQIQSFRFVSPGIYGLQTSRGEHLAAVNTPAAESDLTTMSESLIAQWSNLASAQDRSQGNATATSAAEDNSILKSFETWLLPLLLIIILVESILGNAHLRVRREVST
jgi:hypothetical protein